MFFFVVILWQNERYGEQTKNLLERRQKRWSYESGPFLASAIEIRLDYIRLLLRQ